MYYLWVIILIVFTQDLPSEAPVSKFRTQAPWEFLLSASRNTLQSYELSRLGHAANLRKEMVALFDQYLEESTAANLARWLIEQRQLAATVAQEVPASDLAAGNDDAASDNVLADNFVPPANFRHRS